MAFKAGPERGSRSAENVFFTIKEDNARELLDVKSSLLVLQLFYWRTVYQLHQLSGIDEEVIEKRVCGIDEYFFIIYLAIPRPA